MSYQILINPEYGTEQDGKPMYVIPMEDKSEFPQTLEAAKDWVKHLKEIWAAPENIFIVARYVEDIIFDTEWVSINNFKKTKKPRIQFSFINENLPDPEEYLETKIFYSLKRCKQYVKKLKCPKDYYLIEDLDSGILFNSF